MIHVNSNADVVMADLVKRLTALSNPDQVVRTVAESMLGEVHHRIHTEGLAADGNAIGTYSDGYMKVRTGAFISNEKFKRGKKKGETKTTGAFTKGKQIGEPRPTYNRTSDTKVVISLTRQMENDFSVLATKDGYGLGYKNSENRLKVDYVENTYGEKIFALTGDEREQVSRIAEFESNKILNG